MAVWEIMSDDGKSAGAWLSVCQRRWDIGMSLISKRRPAKCIFKVDIQNWVIKWEIARTCILLRSCYAGTFLWCLKWFISGVWRELKCRYCLSVPLLSKTMDQDALAQKCYLIVGHRIFPTHIVQIIKPCQLCEIIRQWGFWNGRKKFISGSYLLVRIENKR